MTLVAVYAMTGNCQNEGCGLPPEQHELDGRCMTLVEERYFVGERIPVFIDSGAADVATMIRSVLT